MGTIVTPDLDVDRAFIGDRIIKKKGGKLAQKLWLLFWMPYKTSCKHGRFMSHFPVFGTTVRLLYIFFWFILLPHLVYWFLVRPERDLALMLEWYLRAIFNQYFLYGLMSSDTIHYFLDILTKEKTG
jgi:uncharacterized metal-binding protein